MDLRFEISDFRFYMLPRQQQLLKKIIQEYIKTAEPVGSLKLSAGTVVSSATIRNEMILLEQEGLIFQPHTSAGRMPTEKGYCFYIENFVKNGRIDSKCKAKLVSVQKNLKGEERLKGLARLAAELSQEAVILSFDAHRLYFTGLSYLFAKPEFSEQARVTSISQILDHCEEVMPLVLKLLKDERRILIGGANPFDPLCSFVGLPIQDEGLFGLLGPMRMDYERNLGIINCVEELI